MVSGVQKNIIKDALAFYIDTTGKTVENFIFSINRNAKKEIEPLPYEDWLAVKIYAMLKENGMALSDCLDFRNLSTQISYERNGMNVTPLWKNEIAKCINSVDISDYEFLELSSENSELEYLGIDKKVSYYSKKNKEDCFYNKVNFGDSSEVLSYLPKKIQKAITEDKPLFINMNPFLEKTSNLDSVIDEMKQYGYAKKAYQTVFFASLFRIISFCKENKLTKVRIGFFTPLQMYYEDEQYKDFYTYFKKNFIFNRGICFSPKSVGVRIKDALIGYMIWDYTKGQEENQAIVLDEKIQQTDSTITTGNSCLIAGKRESLYDWVKESTYISNVSDIVPIYTNIRTKSEETIKRGDNVLGYQSYANNLLRSIKRTGVFSLPIGNDSMPVTEQNFKKAAASYAVRICVDTPELRDPPFLSSPDTSIKNIDSWLADAVIFFLFNNTNMTKSYREDDLDLGNRFFPLAYDDIKTVIRDRNVKDDLEEHKPENEWLVKYINDIYGKLSMESISLYTFCRSKIMESLSDGYRSNIGYRDSLIAWDASFYQIRGIDGLFTTKDNSHYAYLLSALKDILRKGLYKYGFLSSDEL